MRENRNMSKVMLTAAIAVIVGGGANIANAVAPCGDFGECKTLVEINASDGDIGFHFLMDGHDLIRAAILGPRYRTIFRERARGPLRKQYLTETFVESAEPLCWEPEPEDDEYGEEFVTLEEFIDRWQSGTYTFVGFGKEWEWSRGETTLEYDLPAAPAELDYDEGMVSWEPGTDLGECADSEELDELVEAGVLPIHPASVLVAEWEVVFEADIPGNLKYSVRVPGDILEYEVSVPQEFLDSLPANTPAKIEVGAIGFGDNATFFEEGDICVNEDEDGCEFED